MRKLVALLLALCLMCGAWTLAGAEEGTQTYETSRYAYDVPADWSCLDENVWDDGAVEYTSAIWEPGVEIDMVSTDDEGWVIDEYACELYEVRIALNYNHRSNWIGSASGVRDLEEAWEYTVSESFNVLGKKSWDGRDAICGINPDRMVFLWIDGPLMGTINVNYSYVEPQDYERLDDYITNSIFEPVFYSLRTVDGEPAATVSDPVESAEGKQGVRLGNATFQLPEDLVISMNTDTNVQAENDRYDLSLLCVDWDSLGIDITLTGDVQVDNAFWCAYLAMGGDENIAANFADQCLHSDCNMLNGAEVMLFLSDELVVLTHYYRGTGFFILLSNNDGANMQEMMEVAINIALSFRLDGVSEEDMMADAEALAAAEAEAAALAAMQKHVVITADSGKIRTEASISGGLIKTAYNGESYVLLREEGDWYVVEVDGRTGYIHSGVAEIQ